MIDHREFIAALHRVARALFFAAHGSGPDMHAAQIVVTKRGETARLVAARRAK